MTLHMFGRHAGGWLVMSDSRMTRVGDGGVLDVADDTVEKTLSYVAEPSSNEQSPFAAIAFTYGRAEFSTPTGQVVRTIDVLRSGLEDPKPQVSNISELLRHLWRPIDEYWYYCEGCANTRNLMALVAEESDLNPEVSEYDQYLCDRHVNFDLGVIVVAVNADDEIECVRREWDTADNRKAPPPGEFWAAGDAHSSGTAVEGDLTAVVSSLDERFDEHARFQRIELSKCLELDTPGPIGGQRTALYLAPSGIIEEAAAPRPIDDGS
ncbi:hypothetical protein [Rhodococcus sp. RDE2]|uniref:hypothetical protein n=1 Tax=Rhodococcus sp. RDE2 TaxID=2885078 RepID=UPI001E5D8337|nr:hypothetical protein [Rhodococcus sp. RDE2]BDB63296.1 hypothetical protein RDE2_50900 [Rhodococcus sp. RDE2]